MPRMLNNELQTYIARENKQEVALNGPVYFINGVSYDASNDNAQPTAKTINKRQETTGGGTGNNAPRRAEELETIVLHGSYVYLDGATNAPVPAQSDGHDNYMYQSNNFDYSSNYPDYTEKTSLVKLDDTIM